MAAIGVPMEALATIYGLASTSHLSGSAPPLDCQTFHPSTFFKPITTATSSSVGGRCCSFAVPALSSSTSETAEAGAAAAVASASTVLPPLQANTIGWRELQGSNDWSGLLDPLHPALRDEIVRYANFANVCYRAFDQDPASKFYLNCKHGKHSILPTTGIEDSGYVVTRYLYATTGITVPTQQKRYSSRWIGYVAVSDDDPATTRRLGRRDIMVSFRGTVTSTEWLANFKAFLTPARLDPHGPRPDVQVESGFLSLYTSNDVSSRFGTKSCREQVLCEVARLIGIYKDEPLSITLTGHSMGSSLALLFAYDLAELGLNRDASGAVVPITVYSFAGPRVGNPGFRCRCEELGVKVLRVVNVNDPVTKVPGLVFNEGFGALAGRFEMPWSYAHVGMAIALDMARMLDPVAAHDMDRYIGKLECMGMMQTNDQEEEEEEEEERRI